MRTVTSTARPTTTPRHADRLLAFANSVDNDEQTDDLATPDELLAWLHTHDLGEDATAATTRDLTLARRLRDALRDAMRAHHDGHFDPSALDDIAGSLPLRLVYDANAPGLRPADTGVRGALAGLIVAVTVAAADDTWRRLKICAFDECQWAYFDASKNRSRTWCEWGCGNRVKTRNYRARRKAAERT